jgi:hypothetical protein
MYAPKSARYCYKTKLPEPYLELACDFEANDYCSAATCSFWFEHIKNYVSKNKLPFGRATADPELSLKIVNKMLVSVRSNFNAGLDRLGKTMSQTGNVDPRQEKLALEIAFQASVVLFWYCDKSRTQIIEEREVSWIATYNLATAIVTRLRQHTIEMRCLSKVVVSQFSTHCTQINDLLRIFQMLLLELQRRSQVGVSQCLQAM